MSSEIIRKQNDKFRKESCLNGICPSVPGKAAMTAAVSDWLKEGGPDRQIKLVTAVANFNNFHEGNDPYGEHDFGEVEVEGERLYWKIDYYDRDYEMGSPSPADLEVTRRVMMIMFVQEY